MNKHFLGEFIEPINRINSKLEYSCNDVMGITNTKELMETKARVEYADISKFNILFPSEFIYNPRTSRNGEKVGMAYNNTTRNILFTFNNVPFRIKKSEKNNLDSDYLYLFFLNSEFDRYARFKSWGSATELFLWQDMKMVEINLPSLKVQKMIVGKYNNIINKIAHLKKINNALLDLSLDYILTGDNLKNIKLSEIKSLKEISSGIGKYFGKIKYISTGDVDFDIVADRLEYVSFDDRPSRANMKAVPYSIWFAKMQNTKKILFFDDSYKNFDDFVLSTGFEGITCDKSIFYYLLAYLYSDKFEDEKNKYATGTTQIAINSEALNKIEVPFCSNYETINDNLKLFFKNIEVNIKEIETLEKMKSLLLKNIEVEAEVLENGNI